MRLAVCLSSELRHVTHSLPRIKLFCEHYFKGYEIDYFIYAPNKIVRNYTALNMVLNKIHTDYVTNDIINFVNKILEPKLFVIENDYEKIDSLVKSFGLNENDYKHTSMQDGYHFCSNYRWFNQYHFAQQVIELKQQYEQKHNFKYDLVFRTRPDFYPLDFEHIDSKTQALGDGRLYGISDYYKSDWPNSVFVSYIDVRRGNAQIGDHYFLSSSQTMDVYHTDAIKKIVQMHNDIASNKFDGIYDTLKYQLDPPERKWFFLGLVNRVSFVTNIFIPSCLVRDYYEYNNWECENQNTKIYEHQQYVAELNALIHSKISCGYQMSKMVDYFKTSNLWQFKNIQSATDFFNNNSQLFL